MNSDTLLHRQIHPNFVQNKVISIQAFQDFSDVGSIAFTPNKDDNKQLSVYNGEKFTPGESHAHFVKTLQSFGVLSVSKSECESVEPLSVFEDNIPYDGHTVVDFTQIQSKNQIEKKAAKLKIIAMKRGWQFLGK